MTDEALRKECEEWLTKFDLLEGSNNTGLIYALLRFAKQQQAAGVRMVLEQAETFHADCKTHDRQQAYRLVAHWCEAQAKRLEER